MAEEEEELKSLLMKVEEESEKVGLKLDIQKTKIMASSPSLHGIQSITSWQIDGEAMERLTDFTFLDSKITADGDCSDEIKRCLLLGRQAMTNLAAAAAKLLQLCPTLGNPRDTSPLGSSVSGILQARILEWVAISFSNAFMHAKSLQSCLTLCNPMNSTPPGSTVHRILSPGKSIRVGCHFLLLELDLVSLTILRIFGK